MMGERCKAHATQASRVVERLMTWVHRPRARELTTTLPTSLTSHAHSTHMTQHAHARQEFQFGEENGGIRIRKHFFIKKTALAYYMMQFSEIII